MIPFVEQPSVSVGPLNIHAFGVIVAASVLAGFELGRRLFPRLGLDPRIGEGLALYAIVGGFVGAHLFSALLYFPEEVARNPLVLLKVWEDISSFGGMLGGLAGVWLYLWRHAPTMRPSERWAYADVIAFVFPFALAIGRIACSLAHDHPGTLTTFPLAVGLETEAARAYISDVYRSVGKFAELPPPSALPHFGFHDLGWYEFLYLALFVCPIMLVVHRKPRRPGTSLVLFILLYMPARFALDRLRIADVRYAGLTPAQWAAILMLLLLPVVRMKQRRDGPPV